MDAQARAGIEFSETALRYAEVEQYGQRYRLLRLGTCDFDFDLVRGVLEGDDPTSGEVVAEALLDVFSGSIASVFTFAIHPQLTHSFVTSADPSTTREERDRRVAREAALLLDANPEQDVMIDAHAESMWDDRPNEYVNVLATPVRRHAAMRNVLSTLRDAQHYVKLTTQGASAVMSLLDRETEASDAEGRGYRMTVGCYRGFAEFCIVSPGGLRYSVHAPAVDALDYAYFAATYLQELGVPLQGLDRVFVYGDAIPEGTYDALGTIWPGRTRRLDPLEVVDLDPDTLTGEFASEIYAPCVGVAL